MHEKRKYVQNFSLENLKRRRNLGYKCTSEDNIKTDHTEGYGGVSCICMVYDRNNASIEINRWVYKRPYVRIR